ncbi:MAG: pilus assembly protein TadG-related protein [Bryobacteraceae bacterium]
MRKRTERGQALFLVLVAMSFFLIGAIGMAVDGSHLYAQRQMAQAAADAGAQAAIMSIFDHTNTTATNPFNPANGSFTCTTTDGRTPCVYAANNGFNTTADTVVVSFPCGTCVPGVSPSPDYPYAFAQVTVTRSVSTTLMRFLGPTASNVKALAVAAIVQNLSPVPIVVLHPTLAGSFSLGGTGNTTKVTICGGPSKSIQVNSNATAAKSGGNAVSIGGNPTIDLSKAGPADDGNCTTGTGADFGVTGGPVSASGIPTWLSPAGTTEHYLQPSSILNDPLENVTPPSRPGTNGTATALANSTNGCPAAPAKPCMLFTPGYYGANWCTVSCNNVATKISGSYYGIAVQNITAVFAPGIYYIDGGGFGNAANGNMLMATGLTDTTTGTSWTGNMLVYNTGTAALVAPFNVGANSNASLVGAPNNSTYQGILFFQDRSTPVQLFHSLGGNGSISLIGTLYMHRLGDWSKYQAVSIGGTPSSTTLIQGEIIVDTLALQGNGSIAMNLNPNLKLPVNQIALVK